jgi:hypothetical protein
MNNKLENAIKETIKWLDNEEEAKKDEYEHKRKLLEDIVNETLWHKNPNLKTKCQLSCDKTL